jgi:hypothetical protein
VQRPNRAIEAALLASIVLLTLATGYIHYWVGGVLLTLNAAGYLGLAVLAVTATLVFRRGLPLVLLGLAAYAGATILGWLVMGPYFDVAYLAKAIEIALIVAIGVQLRRMGSEPRTAITWLRTLPSQATRLFGRANERPAAEVEPPR